jgi:hypothetical protein
MKIYLICSVFVVSALAITFTNPERGESNSPYDAHDGPIEEYDGIFYRYSMAYGDCKLTGGDDWRGFFTRSVNKVV